MKGEFYKMKKIIVTVLCTTILLTMVACNTPKFPRVHYENSGWRYDSGDLYVEVDDGYVLDFSHPYDKAATDDGYDLIFHFAAIH